MDQTRQGNYSGNNDLAPKSTFYQLVVLPTLAPEFACLYCVPSIDEVYNLEFGSQKQSNLLFFNSHQFVTAGPLNTPNLDAGTSQESVDTDFQETSDLGATATSQESLIAGTVPLFCNLPRGLIFLASMHI